MRDHDDKRIRSKEISTMKNILVTGAAGFIGSNFVRHMLTHDPELSIVTLDALTYAGSLSNLENLPAPGRHNFIHGDICDRETVDKALTDHTIDTIVHFAAESHVDRSIDAPDAFVKTNVFGTFTLLEAARNYNIDVIGSEKLLFHHVSTDEVHGDLAPNEDAWTEESPYLPNSPYAASKAASDHLVRSYGRTYGLPYIITNCSNNYGPWQFPEKLIPLTVFNALEGREIPVYGDGGQIRDWLYVEDHCEAIRLAITQGRPGETYHIGGDNQTSNIDLVTAICRIIDTIRPEGAPHTDLIRYVADRPGHDRRYAIDTGKIRSELGWKAKMTLDKGLEKTIAWYLANKNWVEEISNRPSFREWMDKQYRRRQAT